ncbi:MAG: DUF4058 family protein [Pirellulaceae bacterium]|nr:DUF4058 family protein [Pirellulaceae bacterium]
MPSPFPGIDPYLEDPAFWSDFHSTFINYWRETIADALPDNYEAGIGERVYLIENEPEARKLALPDVTITDDDSTGQVTRASGVATLEPVTIPLTILDGPRETYIEIIHRPDRSLVTALELLSPTNKNKPGRTEYLAKRNALLYQDVHLAELDLLRGGQRLPLAKPLPPGDAYYLVSRAELRPDCQVYSWMLPDRLPILPVPLRAPDADLLIDLAVVFNTAYDRGRYRRRIDYNGTTPVQLNANELSWAKSLL